VKRRLFIASSLGALGLAGCSSVKDSLTSGPFRNVLLSAERWNHAVIGTHGMAREYSDRDVDKQFRTNGFDTPSDASYTGLVKGGFHDYRLAVDGLVDRPQGFSLAALRAAGLHTQITRHDCVEGWSAIGKWSGVRLATVLAMVQPKSTARYCVFHCIDSDQNGTRYYESLDLVEAAHPQTILALDLNGAPLDPDHGAPVRLKVPTQLGYKSAKWVQRIELVATLPGAGGYWEDQRYEWYAGI
jgi:DMSO/TMAO reductase YedYZ molybdopterin-dependent catalytic subunit